MQTLQQGDELSGFGRIRHTSPRLSITAESVLHNPQSSDNAVGNALQIKAEAYDRSTDDGRGSMVLIAELFVYGLLIALVAFLLWVRG